MSFARAAALTVLMLSQSGRTAAMTSRSEPTSPPSCTLCEYVFGHFFCHVLTLC